MDDQDDDQDFVIYGDAEEESYTSKGLPDYRQKKETGRTYASLHQHLSKKREEESTKAAFIQRGGLEQRMSEQPHPVQQAVYGGAPFGENVIANLEARFKETAVGMHAYSEEDAEPATAEPAAIEAQNPLAALGLQPHTMRMQQPSREDRSSHDRDGISSGYHGAPTNRKKRQLGGTSRVAMEQFGGYGSKRKTPQSKQQYKFAILVKTQSK
ncbi:hypothetical protein WJX75_006553 [Coccomyxa subellipsoidea]|uniref:Uncharacterized protein n=1 Tax=Coccomyxa subellipsoidea TaxID=248742 RepID=A0ABR2YSL3_9CHLO